MRYRSFYVMMAFALGCVLKVSAACKVLDQELSVYYEGACRDGLADGRGFATGTARYEGYFKGGKKHGEGLKVWANGDWYKGDFKSDMKDGYGIYSWGERSQWPGDTYRGQYRDDRRNGRGAYEWASGDRFDGLWKDDLRYGESAMERQRQRAKQGWQESVGKVGALVCSDATLGVGVAEGVHAKIEALEGGGVTVLVVGGAETNANMAAGMRIGSHVTGDFSDWLPCPLSLSD